MGCDVDSCRRASSGAYFWLGDVAFSGTYRERHHSFVLGVSTIVVVELDLEVLLVIFRCKAILPHYLGFNWGLNISGKYRACA